MHEVRIQLGTSKYETHHFCNHRLPNFVAELQRKPKNGASRASKGQQTPNK